MVLTAESYVIIPGYRSDSASLIQCSSHMSSLYVIEYRSDSDCLIQCFLWQIDKKNSATKEVCTQGVFDGGNEEDQGCSHVGVGGGSGGGGGTFVFKVSEKFDELLKSSN